MTVFANHPELLRRFRAGDRNALSAVYWFYVARVESTIRRGVALVPSWTTGGTRADVADLVQEVFVRAFEQSARLAYDGSREYGPLLLTIARNAVVDHLRRRGRELQMTAVQIDHLVEQDPPGKLEAPPWADPETMAVVDRYVARLSGSERAVYVQRYVHCRSQEQAAAALGLTRQQVRTLELRVRAGLSRDLSRARLAAVAVHVPELLPASAPRAAAAHAGAGSKDD